jgi:uncharacterized protein (DUF169 family)
MNQVEAAEFIRNDLRLKTLPLATKFLKSKQEFPEKTRRPSEAMGKRVTICQAVTMARLYGWTVGLAKEDMICVPAMISFGFTKSSDQVETMGRVFCDVSFAPDRESARKETESMTFLKSGEYQALVMAPLAKGLFDPDTISIYCNPAQAMRLVQAWVYQDGGRIPGNFGGKVECTEYLIAAFKSGAPRLAIPGMGDRIFSMTQDDEMVFTLPGKGLTSLVQGLKDAGKRIGARYPVTFYQNFQPEFPKPYKVIAEDLDIF